MKLYIINNEIVDFNGFFAYNYIKNTKIRSDNTIVIGDYDSESKVLSRYASKMYIVHLYHLKKDEITDEDCKYEQSKSYLGMQDLKALEGKDLSKIDYIIISEKVNADDDEVDKLIMNIMHITGNYGKITPGVELTAADVTISAFEGVKANAVRFSFYDEVLGGEPLPNPVFPKKKSEEVEKDTKLDSLLLCDNGIFYNVLCALLLITNFIVLGYEWYTNGLKDHQLAFTSIAVTVILVAVLQYIKRNK